MRYILYICNMNKEYICKKCDVIFNNNKGCKSRIPLFCSRKCAGLYNGGLDSVKEKMSKAKIGKPTWNKGVKMWEGKEHPKGMLGKKGINSGRIISDETRKKLIVSHTGLKYPKVSGENHWNWQGGKTSKNEAIRKSAEYKKWRTLVFERDNFICQECKKVGGEIHADHIKPFSKYKELRFNVNNGRTLCVECHYKTDTYGGKMIKYANAIN